MTLDVDYVRRQFPALGGDWIYLDNAGGSQTLGTVAERVTDYLLSTDVQLGASYAPSVQAAERVQGGREAIQILANAAHPEEIVMGPNATVLLRFLADAMASQFEPGDEIVVTNTDHEANIGPWMRLQEERGVVIKIWQCDPETYDLHLSELDRLMTDRTRLVCVTHCSNILGTVNPIKDFARFVHDRGARICVDAVAYAPHRAIDVQDLDADYYCFSMYKLYGPHHAALYVKRDLLLELENIYHFFFDKTKIPGKLEPGNPNYELAYGCTGVLDYLATLGGETVPRQPASILRSAVERGFADIAEHEARIGERLLGYLRGRNDVTIVGRRDTDSNDRVPTVSFTVDGRLSDEIVSAVDPAGIGIRFGHFYARRLIDDLGLAEINGVVRVSMVHYNTTEEIDRLVETLDAVM